MHWKQYFEVFVIYHWIQRVKMQIIAIVWIVSFPSRFAGSSLTVSVANSAAWFSLMKSSFVSDFKAVFFSYRSISWYPLQNANCESFSTKYLDTYRLCKWTPRNNENDIMGLRGHRHCMIDFPIAATLHESFFSKQTYQEQFHCSW